MPDDHLPRRPDDPLSRGIWEFFETAPWPSTVAAIIFLFFALIGSPSESGFTRGDLAIAGLLCLVIRGLGLLRQIK